MARRRSHTTNQAQRAVTTPALTSLLTPSTTYLNYLRRSRQLLNNYSREHINEAVNTASYLDRRRYHPDRVKPAGSVKRSAARLVARGTYSVGFAIPRRVAVCAKRQIRREVLHAYRIAGTAGAARRRRRRNFWSDVRC